MKRHFKKIGIIGGMGPFADEAFISLLNSHSEGCCDASHIPFILDCNCKRPDRSDFLCRKSSSSPLNSLIESTKLLVDCGCDILAMPCNTAHFWHGELLKYVPPGVVFPSMVELTVQAASKLSDRTLLLSTDGTRLCGIYSKAFEKYGSKNISPPPEINTITLQVIKDVKSGISADIFPLLQLCSEMSDSVILGCTELSRAFLTATPNVPKSLRITDSLSVLAQYVAKLYFG